MSAVWSPHVTVAAIIEHDGQFLLVEEHTPEGLRLNQPAGHLEAGESLIDACVRETLEESAYAFTPTHLLGTYLWQNPQGIAFLRFAFCGVLGVHHPDRALDQGIVRCLWLTHEALYNRQADWRSPLVGQCIRDYLAGQKFALNAVYTHANAIAHQ